MRQKGINWRTGGASLMEATTLLQAVNRGFMQTTIQISGQTITAVTKTLGEREVYDFLPSGMQNADNIDGRLFNVAASDVPTGTPELASILWQNTSYTVVRTMPDPAAASVRFVTYRTPPSSDATLAPSGETDAGKRKRYRPPAVTT